ncbi:acyltransferase [Hellea sp.]|nr:acyltransferase [Hellea sp.]
MSVGTSKKPYGHSEYFAALDGFRGLLALFVAIHHATWFSYLNYRTFINEGYVIIDLFFAFSGFLMFTLYAGKLTDKASCMNFMQRRFARLYPIHIFMLLVFLAFAILRVMVNKAGIAEHQAGEILPFMAGASEGWGALLSNLTLTHSMGLHDSLSFNYPSWTISVEFFAYFVFMALMVWMPPRKTWHFGLIAVGVAGLYFGLSRVKPNMDITYDYGFFRCLGGFFTGVIAAWTYQKLKSRPRPEKAPSVTLFTLAEIAIVTLSVAFIIYWQGKLQFFVAPVMFCFIMIFAHDRGLVSRFMSLPVFRYLAKISYSVYMVHVFIAIVFAIVGTRLFPDTIVAGDFNTGLWGDLYNIPYLLCVIASAHFTWKYVEIPGGRFLRKLKWSKPEKKAIKPAPLKG